MAISTRSDAFAAVEETTEGVPKSPASANDFTALQDDLAITPAFDDLENAERLNSLGKAKSIRGLENPSTTFSHYARGSGVEGTAPDWNLFPKSIFGTETSGLTERDVVSATTTAITVDTAEGVDFDNGRPVLIKDGVNGRTVRWSTGVTGETFDLNFALDNAPASGVLLGDPVYWEPANTGHPTLTLWHYVGNQSNGAVEMTAGNRVTSMNITADAAGLVNSSFTAEGIAYHFDPIEITSSNKFLDFTSDNVTDEPVTLTEKTYKDPHDLAEALQAGISAADPLETYTVVYSDTTGKFTIATSTSTVLSILWKTGSHGSDNTDDHVGTTIGYEDAADDTGATTYTSDNAQDWSAAFTPSFDDADPNVAKSNIVFIGDQSDNVCFEASTISIDMSVPKTDILSVCSDSGKSGSIPNEREVTISITALLENYDADKFHRFHSNQDTSFMWTWGEKDSNSDWVEGKTMSTYSSSTTITDFEITQEDNLATLNMTLTTFVNSDGDGEFYYGQL